MAQVNYTIQFDGKTVHGPKNPHGGVMDDFPSYEPTVEGTMKSDVSSPDGNILSAYSVSGSSYATLSGTSMSTPFVAACHALVKSQRPGLGVAEIQDLLCATAVRVGPPRSSDMIVTTAQQGAGMVNVFAAINAKTVIEPTAPNLRDGPRPQNITIDNNAKSTKQTPVSHWPGSYNNLVGEFNT